MIETNNIKKHTDIVDSYDEFEMNLKNGVYEKPWIVYIKHDNGTYEIKYSNNVQRTNLSPTPDSINILENRVKILEEEKIYCTEDEYDEIIADNGYNGVFIVNIETGNKDKLVFYNKRHLYYIYE